MSLHSVKLANAYRSWDFLTRKSLPSGPFIIVVDDLANLDRSQFNRHSEIDDILETFESILKSPNDLSELELLKVKNSVAFLKSKDLKPNRELVSQCGGEFKKIDLNEISVLSSKIKELGRGLPGKYIEQIDSSKNYAYKIIESAYSFLRAHLGNLPALEFTFTKPAASNPFGAQVITDFSGKLILELPENQSFDPMFPNMILHEVLGHVMHFSQLKSNSSLQAKPHLLCISNHTHESFFIEAIAQLISGFLIFNQNWNFTGKDLMMHSELIYHRNQAIAHYNMTEIIDGKRSSAEAAQIHLDLCEQTGNIERLSQKYESITNDLFSVKVALNYTCAFAAVESLLRKSHSEFFKIFSQLINEYHTPETLKNFVLST